MADKKPNLKLIAARLKAARGKKKSGKEDESLLDEIKSPALRRILILEQTRKKG